MAISTDKDTDLATLDPVLKSIRTAIKGEFFIKQQGTLYLPPPGDIASDEQTSKYTRYKDSAEFWSLLSPDRYGTKHRSRTSKRQSVNLAIA